MKVIKPSYEIVSNIENSEEDLKVIERMARLCYSSDDMISDDESSAVNITRKLIKNHHLAMIEHSSLSVILTVDRGVTHELVRHRMASFAQESTRFCLYTDDKFDNEITVIKPVFFEEGTPAYNIWYNSCLRAEEDYKALIDLGCQAQEARDVLPTSLKARIGITANYREWRHIFALRSLGLTGKPHAQMVEVMTPLLEELKNNIPVIFDDITLEG